MRGSIREVDLNCDQHTFKISEHIIVPESKYAISFGREVAIANRIFGGLVVLSAIHFDHDLLFSADEVADVAADRHLPRKLVAVDLTIADTIPENGFRIRLVGAQASCAG